MTMQIRVGFSTSTSWHARIVRWFTRSEVSHAFFLLENSFLGIDVVLEADPPDVHLRALSEFVKKNRIVKTVDMPDTLREGLVRSVRLLGRPYDYGAFFGVGLVLMGGWLKKKWKHPLNSRKALDCVEMIVTVLQASGYPNAKSLEAAQISPQQLMEFLSAEHAPV